MNKKQLEEQRNTVPGRVLTREEILGKCKKLETRPVEVPGWDGKIMMQNVDFAVFMELRASAPTAEDVNAMLIAATCVDLEIEDAYKLQKGHFAQFGRLLDAVNRFNGFDEQSQEQAIKN